MSPERLLAQFDCTVDAPNAVPRLRRFVLDLAVRGKLVEQDPADEPAVELLKRVATEKSQLYKDGKIRKPKPISVDIDTHYKIPSSWGLVPLTAILVKHLGGGTPSKNNKDYWNGSIPWASVKDVGKSKYLDRTIDYITEAGLENSSSNLIEPGNLVVVTRMGLGKISINRISVCINQDLRALILSDLISVDYAYNFFLTHDFVGSGLTVKGIKLNELLSIPFPLPPIAEQRRIVAKVDELMVLIDRLEQTRKVRADTRDRLTKASYARLSGSDADDVTFRSNARFAVKVLPAVTARADQVKRLRRAILDLAVRGKLVDQDPDDEPASYLLKRIALEKEELVQNRKIRMKKLLPPIKRVDEPFSVPRKWEWCLLGNLFHLVTDGAHHTPRYIDKGVPFLSVKDVSSGSINFTNVRYISESQHAELCRRCRPEKGDILLTKVGTTGIAVPIKTKKAFSIFVSLALLKFSTANLSRDYLCYLINSPLVRQQSKDGTQGVGNQNLVLRLINGFALPIPPLDEQSRIATKVDELMALCDNLEAALTTGDNARRSLLDALVNEALHRLRE